MIVVMKLGSQHTASDSPSPAKLALPITTSYAGATAPLAYLSAFVLVLMLGAGLAPSIVGWEVSCGFVRLSPPQRNIATRAQDDW
jgi:hypothetical protein